MLSLVSPAVAAMPARARFRMGTSLVSGCAAVPRERATEAAAATAAAETAFADLRPQASAGRVLLGNATHAAGQATTAWQQRTSQKFAHTTRITTAGGGVLGPHPARDPV